MQLSPSKYKGGIAMYNEYIRNKCKKCQNRHNNEDKCEIKQYAIKRICILQMR